MYQFGRRFVVVAVGKCSMKSNRINAVEISKSVAKISFLLKSQNLLLISSRPVILYQMCFQKKRDLSHLRVFYCKACSCSQISEKQIKLKGGRVCSGGLLPLIKRCSCIKRLQVAEGINGKIIKSRDVRFEGWRGRSGYICFQRSVNDFYKTQKFLENGTKLLLFQRKALLRSRKGWFSIEFIYEAEPYWQTGGWSIAIVRQYATFKTIGRIGSITRECS